MPASGSTSGTRNPDNGSERKTAWLEYRQKIRAVEHHAAECQTCDLALNTPPVGKFPMCPQGDLLVGNVYRDIYTRHRLMVRARQQHYGTRRDPLAPPARIDTMLRQVGDTRDRSSWRRRRR